MNKRVLLLTCAVAALSSLAGVTGAAAAAAPAASDQASTVGEVIVTAEKRSVNIQQVPVAVTAFSSKERAIEGISTVQDITNFTPGLTYSSQLDRPVMRGLARNNNIYLSDSAVAVYDDDLFTNSTFLVGRDDLFIDQVEVLLGPQGTLYGRNAIGGLINTLSKRPSETFGGEVRVTAGNYAYSKIEGTVTGPIPGIDGLTFRLDAYFLNQDKGYFTNVHGGPQEGDVRHDPYGQLQLQYKKDNDEIWLSMYDLTFNNDRGGPGSLLGTPTSGPYEGSLTGSGELFFNPNFGVLPQVPEFSGGAFGTSTASPAGGALGPVAGSVTGLVPGLTNNPALGNIRDFAHDLPTLIKVNGAYSFNFHWLHHFDGFDAKYVGGYSQYQYSLYTSDFLNDNSSITSFQIPLNPNGFCASLVPLGACAPLTVNPREGFTYETHTKWFSHELTLSSTTNGPVQWIGGVYYYDEKDNNPETELAPDQPQIKAPAFALTAAGGVAGTLPNPSGNYLLLDYQDDIRSTAIYGQVDWKITDTLKLTVGLRYTYDQKSGMEEARYILFQDLAYGVGPTALNAENLGKFYPAVDDTLGLTSAAPAKGVTCLPFEQTKGGFAGDLERCLGDTSSAVTGTAGLEWSPDRDTLAYFRYNRGYKAFGLNAGFIGANPEAAPEYVDDYEIGYKKTVSRNLVIDVDAFYYNYLNEQVPLGVPICSAATGVCNDVTEFINIPKAISEGIEATAQWTPVDHLNLSLVYGLDHTAIESSCSLATGKPVGSCYTDTQNPGLGFQNPKGHELPQAPENKIAFNATYTMEFDPGDLILSGSYIWKDRSYADIFQAKYAMAPAWDQVDLRATWSGNHDKYEVVFYVKNLFNTLGYDAAAAGGYILDPIGGNGTPTENTAYDLTPPRLYGVELHYKF